ncbi:MAG: hypothetical protein HOG97_02470 [Candidatus Marinimicrobia bacterium]|jgi:hypothetical protein|nr:hypothetical protein [Candidatus Neomarinimicrobiota bacterium]
MINSKETLAKLLATENVSIHHKKVRTASFNLKDRVLNLPIWENMEDFTYDHLVGHEVGHALYTPLEGWHDSVSERGSTFKSYLNVIEDARIEKLIMRKYPGLRRNFVKSYKKMLAEGFFGGDIDTLNQFSFIDRLNVKFKCGRSAKIQFSSSELKWLTEIENIETFEEAMDVAERLYNKAKEEKENEENDRNSDEELINDENEEDMESGFDDDLEPDDLESDEDNSFEGNTGKVEDEEDEEEGDFEKPIQSDEDDEDDEDEDDFGAKTDKSLRESIAEELSENPQGEIFNLTNNFGDKHVSKFIVSYKEIISKLSNLDTEFHNGGVMMPHWYEPSGSNTISTSYEEEASELYTKFLANNKKSINYLVKEFEMKKSAASYARSFTAKTGVIDPVLMNSYLYNDDIFKKATIVPDGKNHGMIMYLDWSGSMASDLFNTVEQTLSLVYFCRQVNIPFRVYAFTSNFSNREEEQDAPYLKEYRELKSTIPTHTIMPTSGFRLMEFFNNKMNKQQFSRMTKILLVLGKNPGKTGRPFSLGGTPLQDTLALAPAVYDLFQRSNPTDIVNTIFLTDGDSHSAKIVKADKVDSYTEHKLSTRASCLSSLLDQWDAKNTVYINDPVTKKRYRITNRKDTTKQFLKMYGERTGSNVVGFRIVTSRKLDLIRELESMDIGYTQANEIWESMKLNNYTNLPGYGYDKYFILKGGKYLKSSNGHFEVAHNAKKGQIANAFKRANKGKIISRSLLNEFIREVA